MAKALIVEDELIITLAYKGMLKDIGFDVTDTASSATEAIERFRINKDFDLIILDYKLKGEETGMDVANTIRLISNVPILFTSGNSHDQIASFMGEIANSSYLVKPVTAKGLQEAVLELVQD